MPGFKLHASNRTEILLEEMAGVVSAPLRSPLESEVVVVQSKGIERWLAQQLSDRFGIWANCVFPFPNRVILDLFRAVLEEVPDDALYSIDSMTWRILRLLPLCLDRPEFEPLRHYLEKPVEGLKRFQLAQRIAATFDEYLVYRPDLLLEWEAGSGGDWQGQLWRQLVKDCQVPHRAAIRRAFFQEFARGTFDPRRLPARISIFGIPALPPFHLEVFTLVAQVLDVHLFFMNPCREYWGDIISEKGLAKIRQRRRGKPAIAEDLHYEQGNSLLASMGTLGQDFLGLLIDQERVEEVNCFEEPGEHCLLTCLQTDILNLRDQAHASVKREISPEDDSLQIHACHSPMREMEVLYDHLLALFERHRDLAPKDIVVMAPDIELYAPFIGAVFGGASRSGPRIPYSVADRSPRQERPVVQSFFKLLTLAGSRLGTSQVLDVLESLPVRQHFGLDSSDLEVIRHWLESTRIRWGIDAADRRRQNLPAFDENSWKAGLRRLLLGYALPAEGEQLFAGIPPFDDMEGKGSQVLGRFVEFLERLFTWVRSAEQSRTLSDWSRDLLSLMDGFFTTDEDSEREALLLRQHLAELSAFQELCHFNEVVGIDLLRYYLERCLAVSEMSYGFLTGGVTFCSLLPMRSIPFRVVALVGMNYDAFPRSYQPVSFDLTAKAPRPGDRSFRSEDRYLFLEALLSARDCLYISYVGQSQSDNREIPPSVLVSELMDSVGQGYLPLRPGQCLADRIVVRHPLQAFSPSYFRADPQLFTYAEESLEAHRARSAPAPAPTPFVSHPIGEPLEEWRNVDLRNLKQFFRNPAEYFFRQRLGIHLEEGKSDVDREPFSLEGLDAYHMKQELLEKRLRQEDLSSSYSPFKAKGILPTGEAGKVAFQKATTEVEIMAVRLQELMESSFLEPLPVELEIAGFRLTGKIDGIRKKHLLRYRCAKIKPKDRLGIWLDHLILNLAPRAGDPGTSILLGPDGRWTYPFVAHSGSILARLLAVYWQGLSEPLQFFPESAYLYAMGLNKGKPPTKALEEANRRWEESEFSKTPSEKKDLYFQLGFGKVHPLDDRFQRLAVEIFQPLLQHQQED
jgi:exodeoxyribonuclease V gamma subunit